MALIVLVAVVLEIVLYLAYRNPVFGWDGRLALGIVVNALIAVGIVWMADRYIRRHRHDRFANLS